MIRGITRAGDCSSETWVAARIKIERLTAMRNIFIVAIVALLVSCSSYSPVKYYYVDLKD